MVTLGADNPYDRVVGTIGGCDPGRTLAALADVPRRSYSRRICGGNFISRNATATGAENKICSLVRVISSGGLSSGYTVNRQLRHRCSDAPKVVTVNQISITILTQGEN
jgi:hypothetical protein